MDSVRQLLALYEKVYVEETPKHISENLHALIVLEGLDGSGNIICKNLMCDVMYSILGKSTMTKRLARTLDTKLLSTPPECLLQLRPLFDGEDYKLLRPAFYSLGNYIAALQIKTILQKQAVVLDR